MMPATLTPVNPNYIAPLKPEDIVRFAPQVTFHPNERSFPCSIQHLLTGATLKSHSDAHLSVPLQGDPSRLAPVPIRLTGHMWTSTRVSILARSR